MQKRGHILAGFILTLLMCGLVNAFAQDNDAPLHILFTDQFFEAEGIDAQNILPLNGLSAISDTFYLFTRE